MSDEDEFNPDFPECDFCGRTDWDVMILGQRCNICRDEDEEECPHCGLSLANDAYSDQACCCDYEEQQELPTGFITI